MELHERIFAAGADNFSELAIEVFNYQYQNNIIYRQYCNALHININTIDTIEKC